MIIVKKFGGTSVETPERIQAVANHLIRSRRQGHKVVAVVSAMGHTTDHLIELASKVAPDPDARELDALLATGESQSCALLALAIRAKHMKAVSFSGEQAGVRTDTVHGRAKILTVKPSAVRRALKERAIPVVAGFQGMSAKNEVTTLGRGGSDLTAVALAAALRADLCELYKDVDGIYTANPRIVKSAKLLKEMSYDELLELSSLGAQVVHARAVIYARQYHVPLYIRSSFHDGAGTWIVREVDMRERPVISGVVSSTNEAKVTILGIPDRPGIAAKIFKAIARQRINVDVIIQDVSEDGMTNISFSVPMADLRQALAALKKLEKTLPIKSGIKSDRNIAKVSLVGSGMVHNPGVAAAMFEALAKKRVNIQMISTSEIKITCIVAKKDANKAVRVLHKRFIG